MYRVKWMANPLPRDLWRVSVFSWLVQGSYLGGGAGLFLHPHPISQEGCSPCSLHWHTGWKGASRSLGRGPECLSCTRRRSVKQELVAKQIKSDWSALQKQSVQPAGRTVTPGSSQGSTDQEKEQKVNRERDWGQNMPPNKPGATLHCWLGP